MSPLAPSKLNLSYQSDSSDNSRNGNSSTESIEVSRKMYTINELMYLRNIDCMQPAKFFNTPVINDILRPDLDHMPAYTLFPPMQMDFLPKPNDSVQNRFRQFHNQRIRHSARSIEELNPRNGSYPQKRHNRHNNGKSWRYCVSFFGALNCIRLSRPQIISKFIDRQVRRFEFDCAYRMM